MEGSRGMSEKTLKTLVGALVVIAGLWAVAALFSSQGDGGRGASGDIATFFDDISEVSVTSVRMNGPDYNSELSGGLDNWAVNGYQADSNLSSLILTLTFISFLRNFNMACKVFFRSC